MAFSITDLTVTSNSSLTFLKLRHSAVEEQHERGNKITGLRLIANFFTKGNFNKSKTKELCFTLKTMISITGSAWLDYQNSYNNEPWPLPLIWITMMCNLTTVLLADTQHFKSLLLGKSFCPTLFNEAAYTQILYQIRGTAKIIWIIWWVIFSI